MIHNYIFGWIGAIGLFLVGISLTRVVLNHPYSIDCILIILFVRSVLKLFRFKFATAFRLFYLLALLSLAFIFALTRAGTLLLAASVGIVNFIRFDIVTALMCPLYLNQLSLLYSDPVITYSLSLFYILGYSLPRVLPAGLFPVMTAIDS